MRWLALCLLVVVVAGAGCFGPERPPIGPTSTGEATCPSFRPYVQIETEDARQPRGAFIHVGSVAADGRVFYFIGFTSAGNGTFSGEWFNVTVKQMRCGLEAVGRYDARRDYDVRQSFGADGDANATQQLRSTIESRFWTLEAKYDSPSCVDGDWVNITATRSSGSHSVRSHCNVGPPAYQQVYTALQRVLQEAGRDAGSDWF